MKKLLLAFIALVMICVTTDAQTAPSTERQHVQTERKGKAVRHHRHRKLRRHHRHHRMAAELNFSEQQKAQAKLYREDFKKKMTDLNSRENITVKEQRDQRTALLKEQKEKMQSLLTAEQKTKMAQLKTEGKAKGEQHYAARMEKMKSKLNLSDKQVAQLKLEKENRHAKLKAIKEDETMDRTAKKEKLLALKEQMREEHKKIFTADQLKQLEEMKKERMEKKAVK